ncbi:MAG: PAS domain-containing protein [Planctomycetota bacterium]
MAAVYANSEMFRDVVENMRDAILITENTPPLDEPHPRIIYVNPAFERMTGYRFDDVVGRSPRFLQGDGTSRSALDEIRGALSEWKAVRTRLANYRQDGSRFMVEIDIVPSWSDGKLQYWFAVQRDVTETYEELIAKNEQQTISHLKMLAAGVSHDFNNLLQVIMGFTNVLQASSSMRGKIDSQYLATIENATQSASELCSQLLSYAGEFQQDIGLVDVSALVAQNVDLLQATVGDRASVSVKLPGNLPKIPADRGQLQQVLMNLVIKAAEACTENGKIILEVGEHLIAAPSAETTTYGLDQGMYVYVDVVDNGIGMSPDLLRDIFVPYFSTKGSSERGLGLASSIGMIRAQHGEIVVDSTPGMGTTVRILLPVDSVAGFVEPVEPGQRSRKILVIDDQVEIQLLLKISLARFGFDVVGADNGKEGVALYSKFKDEIEMVISDIQMAGFDGFDVLDGIREISSDLPFVLMSGLSTEKLKTHSRG